MASPGEVILAGDDRSTTRDPGPARPGPDSPRSGSRRLAPHRLAAAGIVLVLATAVLVAGGRHAANLARNWLAAQPAYLVPFREIQLDPPPPPWIKSGPRGLLEQVQAEAHWPESLPILSLDLDTLANDFRRGSPWVRNVQQIARPNRSSLIVRLDYRRPVGRISLANGRSIYLDEDAVVLPADDLDPRGLPPRGLPLLSCIPRGWIPVPLSGQALKLQAAESSATGDADRHQADMAAAARLAGFLSRSLDQQADASGPDGPPPLTITAVQVVAENLFVDSNSHLILWTSALGSQRPGGLTDAEKWSLLLKWLETNSLTSVIRDQTQDQYLDFEPTQAVVRTWRKPR
jgi:hypothetical protein